MPSLPWWLSDESRPRCWSYFMGLRRQQCSSAQDGKQFDKRTVEKFKHQVYQYSFWKSSVWINVCHVRQKDVPVFIFSGESGLSRQNLLPRAAWLKDCADIIPFRLMIAVSRKRRKQGEVNRGVHLGDSLSLTSSTTSASLLAEPKERDLKLILLTP